jgi:hypothetical protein
MRPKSSCVKMTSIHAYRVRPSQRVQGRLLIPLWPPDRLYTCAGHKDKRVARWSGDTQKTSIGAEVGL